MKEVSIFIVSDSVGETAQKVISAVMAQFPDVEETNIKRYPFITTEEDLKVILRDALNERAIVVATLVNKDLVQSLADFSSKTGLDYVDYMTPLTKLVQGKTGLTPQEKPGALHKLDQEYFNRVAAIEFAIKYDDGKDPRGFKDSDFVLLGISRTSKTPLSMYLANKSYKVSNLPLIPEVPLPKELDRIPSEKIIGLIGEPERILEIRQSRLQSLGLNGDSKYADLDRIREEVAYSKEVFESLGAHVIQVDDKSIEEAAAIIECVAKK
ncbi:kinase/pyrophosphorylase [Vagococcus lutrae]|uniref:pyruvate, water dikinase regulatory protein n=1 Tax=Vagococcus lutrae TaxID=81947 RepID=UPI001C9802CB|nr:pyruvate, water dikinase regulatory protein [Vagococcus lutrae]MDO5742130.1 pyruvate, water dikinase regulatory protein [Vagococcus sp.]MDT2816642.1 kinase/pyrophosphorylase [Vagococcus lutrae]MDT2825944.1 kinase/pyrophosphorylase [Vagococcus lutrae]QZN88368.1 kinase/pyrophosphorylase [Vagococcus lutrae]UQF22801.1 kinase/pyrophosphorylase [Vagococcus lutrae]